MNSKITLADYHQAFLSKRKKAQQELTQGVNSTFIIMSTLIIGLFLYYVWTLNANATAGYDIRELEQEKHQLLQEKEIIKSKIAQLESLKSISSDMELQQQMEPVEDTKYLVIHAQEQYVYNN